MASFECEVLIVGGRVAGATLASLLGEAGREVLLVDRASFPSQTVSTHFFRGQWGVSNLDRVGVLEEVLKVAPRLVCQYDYADGQTVPSVGPPQEPGDMGFGLSVRRVTLDNILFDRARQHPSVRVMEGTSFVDVVRDGERVVGASLRQNTDHIEVRCRYVIGADGRHSRVASAVGAPYEFEDQPTRALYYQYVRNFVGPDEAAPGPEFSFLGDEIAYVFPSDDNVTCVAASINLERFKELRGKLAAEFPRVIDRHPALAKRFRDATPVDQIRGCGPEGSYVRHPVGDGWALVGDASIHQDPWTGRGIDFASTHATYLAEALRDAFDGHMTENQALSSYHERRNQHGLTGYRVTTELAKDLSQIPR